MIILLQCMFNLDFKPQFYSYPLSTEEYAKIKLRNKEIQIIINKLQNELQDINQNPNATQYQLYKSRIIEKIKIMRQEMRQYGQVLQCHQRIDANLKANRKGSMEINRKLLEQYRVQSLAKQSENVSERLREQQKQKESLRANQRVLQLERNRSKDKKQFQKLFLQSHIKEVNREKQSSSAYQLNKIRLPRINMTNARNIKDQKQIQQKKEEKNISQGSIFIRR